MLKTPVAKTKTLIRCAVTAQLICVFVFAYADFWFSGAATQILMKLPKYVCLQVSKQRVILSNVYLTGNLQHETDIE